MAGKRETVNWSGYVFRDVEPIDGLYAEGDPPIILCVCPECHAGQGEFCVSAISGKVRKCPCWRRAKVAGI